MKTLLQQQNKNYFKKIHHHLFNKQPTKLSSSSEINNIIKEGEVIFKKNTGVGLPDVSKLIDSAISKGKGDQRKQKKKCLIKGKVDSLWTPRNITSLDTSCYEAIESSIWQNIFPYLEIFNMQWKNNVAVEDYKKIMDIAHSKNIYTNIY